MKRILTILAATLLLTAAMAGTASASSYDSVAEELSAIGVFRGTAGGFELDRAPTRSEAAIMLVRLYGAEDEAKAAYEAGEISMPFTDESRLLSRTTEDSVTVTSVLIPWNSCGMTQATILNVPSLTYLPYCFFNILSPIMSIIVAAIGYKIIKHPTPEKQ